MKIKSAAVIKALNNELSGRRRRVSHIREERSEEVYKKVPAIREIDQSVRSIAYDMGRKVIGAKDPDSVRALAEALIKEKTEQRERLLVENGYPADYLDYQYICSDCRDTGRINGELCRCVVQLAVNTAFEDSGLNRDQRFENFDLSLQKTQKNLSAMREIRDAALEYAESFPNNERRDLVYFGPPGVGKTYLLNCIGSRVLERGFSVLKLNALKLIQLTLDSFRTEPEEKPDFIFPDLLIIDDLGTEPMIPNVTVETLLSLLCERQDSGKATLFATNLEIIPNGVGAATIQSEYGERFASRLMSPRNVRLQAVRTDNARFWE